MDVLYRLGRNENHKEPLLLLARRQIEMCSGSPYQTSMSKPPKLIIWKSEYIPSDLLLLTFSPRSFRSAHVFRYNSSHVSDGYGRYRRYGSDLPPRTVKIGYISPEMPAMTTYRQPTLSK